MGVVGGEEGGEEGGLVCHFEGGWDWVRGDVGALEVSGGLGQLRDLDRDLGLPSLIRHLIGWLFMLDEYALLLRLRS